MERLVILSALLGELADVRALLSECTTESWRSTSIISGYFGKNRVKVITLVTGVGKVKAAAATQYVVDHYHPTAILFIGVAGTLSPKIEPGEAVIGERIVEHDFDIQALAAKERQRLRVWEPDTMLFQSAVLACRRVMGEKKVHAGVILTGDQVIVDQEKRALLREIFHGDCIEMEGAAIAHVCCYNHVPYVVIRIISDSADHEAPVHFRKMLESVGATFVPIVRELLAADSCKL